MRVMARKPGYRAGDNERLTLEIQELQGLKQHQNVVTLMGQCRKTWPPIAIFELCTNGNLRDHLRKVSSLFLPAFVDRMVALV